MKDFKRIHLFKVPCQRAVSGKMSRGILPAWAMHAHGSPKFLFLLFHHCAIFSNFSPASSSILIWLEIWWKSNMQAQLLIKSEKGNNNVIIMLLIISIRIHARVISRKGDDWGNYLKECVIYQFFRYKKKLCMIRAHTSGLCNNWINVKYI